MPNSTSLLLDVTRLIWRRWSGRAATGIDRVCLAYLEHFAAHSQAVVQHRLYRRVLNRKASAALFGLLANWDRPFRAGFIAWALRYGWRFDRSGRERRYLNIGHTGLDDPGLQTWVEKAAVRPIYFVHDLIPITHPEFCRDGESRRHRGRMLTVLRTGSGVIGNSQATIDELEEFARSEGVPCPPAVAAWLGMSPLPHTSGSGVSNQATFVTVGTIEGRKNHLFLLQLWAKLGERLESKTPQLLVIGQRGWKSDEAIDLLESGEGLKDHVVEIGGCDDQTLANHLVKARALLFPSLAEGFGIPLVEALELGTPVIASDLPVFREIGQGVPELLDPLDATAWERAILTYADAHAPARRAQLDRMKQFRVPTWQDHFKRVDSWLAAL